MKNITTESVPDVLAELTEAFYDIPFENSDFQNTTFVVAAQKTPARAYRAIGLRMFAKLRAVKELKFGRLLEQVDVDEKRVVIASSDSNEFDKRRAQIEIDQIADARGWTDKLLNDALHELNCLYRELKKYPKYDRTQFEAEEQTHFQISLERQVDSGDGAIESLLNMQHDRVLLGEMLEKPEMLALMIVDAEKLAPVGSHSA